MDFNPTNYEPFEADDYIDDASFRAWVWHQSDEAARFWETFVRDYPHKLPEISQARAVVLGMTLQEDTLSTDEIEARIQATLAKIRQTPEALPDSIPLSKPVWRLGPMRWVVAASVALLLVLGSYWFANNSTQPPFTHHQLGSSTLTEHVNTTGRAIRLRLPDSSTVTLQPNSRLQYPRLFEGGKREVFLTGEAQFQVTHHPSRPFFVYAQNVVTRVLGTSFVVRAFTGESSVQVRVKTGRVAVYAHSGLPSKIRPEMGAILLLPNQQVSYNKEGHELIRTLVAQPEQLPSETPVYTNSFDETPVGKVLESLEQAYSIPIIYNKTELANCLLTATLTNQSFYAKLDLICQAIGGRYEVVDGQVIISSNGCR